jgi:hypothetical protein
MNTSHSSRCWNTLYMYEVDLLWVWMVWEASIITYSMTQVRNQVIIIQPPPVAENRMVLYTFSTKSHSSRCSKSLYMYQKDLLWVWSGWRVSIICNSRTPPYVTVIILLPLFYRDNRIMLHTFSTKIHCSRCSKSLYMYQKDLIGVWSGWRVSIICNSRTPLYVSVIILLPLSYSR